MKLDARRPPRRHPLLKMTLLAACLLAGPGSAAAQPGAGADPALHEGRGENEMVLIHGLGGSARVWDEVEPYLTGTFKVRTFELAGHGATQPVMDPTITKEVARLEAFLGEIDFPYPVLVGHGLGGMIALQYTLDHPGAVRRLILMDAAPMQLVTAEEKAEIGRRLIENYDEFVAERYLNMSPDPAVTEEIVDMAMRTDVTTFVSLLMSSFDFDLTGRLPGLTVPMLVVGSELMFPTPDDSQHYLAHYGFANARALSFKRMAQMGHYMMLERPVHTASVILAFSAVQAEHLQR